MPPFSDQHLHLTASARPAPTYRSQRLNYSFLRWLIFVAGALNEWTMKKDNGQHELFALFVVRVLLGVLRSVPFQKRTGKKCSTF